MMRDFLLSDFLYLLEAAGQTLVLSAVTLLFGGILALFIALIGFSQRRLLRAISSAYVQCIQGTPLLMQLFIAYFLPSVFGYSVHVWTAAVLGLSVNASAFLGEIWRGALFTVPKGQIEAAQALGIGYVKRMALIVIPQAVRIAQPATVGTVAQLIKGTSLVAVIGFVELARAGQLIVNATQRPFLVFGLVAAIYFLICWPISVLSRTLERSAEQKMANAE
jgi:polar amino acid transport system permease protein